jgi:hypothetical protein
VQGYLFKPFNSAPGTVGGPTAVGPTHSAGIPLDQQVNGTTTPLTWQQQLQAAIADAGGVSGLVSSFFGSL